MRRLSCLLVVLAALGSPACTARKDAVPPTETPTRVTAPPKDDGAAPAARPGEFQVQIDQFADIRVLRYRVPGFEDLPLPQKKLAYYLYEAALSGRDIIWDQNYRHNLLVRHTLEAIVRTYAGERSGPEWDAFMVYAKRVWFSSGIHHHYSNKKLVPGFPKQFFAELVRGAAPGKLPLATGQTVDDLVTVLEPILFDPNLDAKRVDLDATKDMIAASATNFYGPGVTQAEVERFYAKRIDKKDPRPISHGLNSQLAKQDGKLVERVWKVGGMYDAALKECVKWLELAKGVAESPEQAKVIGLLVDFYNTGDLHKWDEFSIAWALQKNNTIDFIHGFIEVYNDPLGKRGSYECSVEIIDPEATKHMRVIQDNAQYFEDNSPIMDQHKKKKVTGITYGFVNVAGESGDAAPSTAIGVNLPNADWIRAAYGSKSVSFGNIIDAYDKSSGSGALDEFCNDPEELERAKKYGALAGNLHTALHEVIGHASGQLEPKVGTPDKTVKSYASTLEEGRADLVALYYLMDPKLVEWNVMPSLEVGKAEYDGYIRSGLLVQLRRLAMGKDVEEAHMRNRMWISKWCLEKGAKDSVIVQVQRDGKTYYDIRDYDKLRALFGQLLREVQRIKSQGDYNAARDLVEGYGVKVDPVLHQQVLDRAQKIKTAPYAGFIQPELVPVMDANGKMTDIMVEYPADFIKQMLMYGEKFSFLPDEN